ncbi:MAG: PrsW family intramembrane metalloprotease [Salinivirgaceae bacterium]|nr:PrsW family intramembrane metalloprotease [Salinivirgaceae bacterium]
MTEAIIMIAAAALPALLLWIYICKRDTQREPMSQMFKAFIYGIGIIAPVIVIEKAISFVLFGSAEPETIIGTTAEAFFVAAIPEEAMKLVALLIVLHKNPYFDEHYDGIVYAVCVSLGFATLENIGYITKSDEWVDVATLRALLSVPGHYAFAVLMGYYYSLWYFGGKSSKNLILTLLAPVIAHGCYDTFALSSGVSPELGGACTLLLIYFCIRMHKFAHKKMLVQINKDLAEKGEWNQ